MYQNKVLTIKNQKASRNSISGNSNTLNISDCQALIISIVGNNNHVVINNTSIQLVLIGSQNIVQTLNSNINLSIQGNQNQINLEKACLNIVNNSGNGNVFNNKQQQETSISSLQCISEISLAGRSNSSRSNQSHVNIIENHDVSPAVPQNIPQQIIPRNNTVQVQNNQRLQRQRSTKCFSFNKLLQIFGCVSDSNRRRNNQSGQNNVVNRAQTTNQHANVNNNQLQANRLNNQKPKPIQGLTDQELDKLFSNIVLNEGVGNCLICLTDIEVNEYQTYLVCFHKFHTKCIKKWLKKSPCCPLCQTNQKQQLS